MGCQHSKVRIEEETHGRRYPLLRRGGSGGRRSKKGGRGRRNERGGCSQKGIYGKGKRRTNVQAITLIILDGFLLPAISRRSSNFRPPGSHHFRSLSASNFIPRRLAPHPVRSASNSSLRFLYRIYCAFDFDVQRLPSHPDIPITGQGIKDWTHFTPDGSRQSVANSPSSTLFCVA